MFCLIIMKFTTIKVNDDYLLIIDYYQFILLIIFK